MNTKSAIPPEEMTEEQLKIATEEARQASLAAGAQFDPVREAFRKVKDEQDQVTKRFLQLRHLMDLRFGFKRQKAINVILGALGDTGWPKGYDAEVDDMLPEAATGSHLCLTLLQIPTKELHRLEDLVKKGLTFEANTQSPVVE